MSARLKWKPWNEFPRVSRDKGLIDSRRKAGIDLRRGDFRFLGDGFARNAGERLERAAGIAGNRFPRETDNAETGLSVKVIEEVDEQTSCSCSARAWNGIRRWKIGERSLAPEETRGDTWALDSGYTFRPAALAPDSIYQFMLIRRSPRENREKRRG